MNHHAGIRQDKTFTLRTATKQEGTHACLQTNTNRLHIWRDVLHSIVDCEAVIHTATRAIDIELDVFVWIFIGKMEKLRDNDIGCHLSHFFAEEDNAILEQTRVYIIATLAITRADNDVGH